MQKRPVVAIIGRPNVGKSTLFNALAGKNIAIIHDMPGVTRDCNYVDITLDDLVVTLVDTGGFDPGSQDDVGMLVREHARMAVVEADVIIFLLDGKEGLHPGDTDIAHILRRVNKPVIYAVNKVDGRREQEAVPDFYRLGVETLLPIAARHRVGITDLIEHITRYVPRSVTADDATGDEIVVSILGRPNVGKSSFVNKILGYERLLVSDMAGTTRDPVDSLLRYHGRTIRIIDTAGIRKKSALALQLEKYCVFKALTSIQRSSICVVLIDATQGVTGQDAKIAALVCEKRRACVLVINKWDIIEKDRSTHDRFLKSVADALPFLDYAPVLTVSARTGLRVRKILDTLVELDGVYKKRVATAAINKALRAIVERHPPPRGPRSKTNVYYAAQVEAAPPVFRVVVNNPDAFSSSYIRYCERELRERFGFYGVPLTVHVVPRTRARKVGQ